MMGALSIPCLDLWHNPTRPRWWEPIERERLPVVAEDPLALQVRNLCDVVRGTAAPVVSGREGPQTRREIEAVKQSAARGRAVRLD